MRPCPGKTGSRSANTELETTIRDAFEALPDLPYEGHTAQIEDVLSAIECKRRPLITSLDGRNTIELVTAIYKAGSTGLPVDLPILPDDVWYTVDGIRSNATHFHKKANSVEKARRQQHHGLESAGGWIHAEK